MEAPAFEAEVWFVDCEELVYFWWLWKFEELESLILGWTLGTS